MAAVARDFEVRLCGIAVHLRGTRISDGANAVSDDVTEVEHCIAERWEAVLDALEMRKQFTARNSSRQNLAASIGGYSQSRVTSFTKNELQAMLDVFGRRIETGVPKAQLVDAVLQLKQDIIEENVNLEGEEQGQQSEESILLEATASALKALQEASVAAWVMKPLVTTMGMREGSRNEIEIAKTLPAFFDEQTGAYCKPLVSSSYKFDDVNRLKVLHVRSVGLVESKNCQLLADSPDAIAAECDEAI